MSLVPSDSSVFVVLAVVAASLDAAVLVVVAAFAVAADMIAPPPKPATAPIASVPGINNVRAMFTRL